MNINKERTNLDFFYNLKDLPATYDKSIVFSPPDTIRNNSDAISVSYNGFYRSSPEPKAYIYSADGTQLVEAECTVKEYTRELATGINYDSTTTNVSVKIPEGFKGTDYNVILALDTSNIISRDTLSMWSDAFGTISKLDERYESNLRGLSFSDYYAKPSRLNIEELHRIDYTNPSVAFNGTTLDSTIKGHCVGSSNLEVLNIEKWPSALTEVPFLFARSKIRYMSIPLDLTKILDVTAIFANTSNNTEWLADTANYFEFPVSMLNLRTTSMMAVYANTGITALKNFNISQVSHQIKLLSIFEGTSLGSSKTSLTNVKFGIQTDLERLFAEPKLSFVDGWTVPIDFITTQSQLNLTCTFKNSRCTVSPFCSYLIKSLRPLSLYGTFYGSAFKLESVAAIVSRTNFNSISTDRCVSTAYLIANSNNSPVGLGIEDFDMATVRSCEGMFQGTYAGDFTFKPGLGMLNASYVFSKVSGEAAVYGQTKNPITRSVTLDLTDSPNITTLYSGFNAVNGGYTAGKEGGVNITIIYNKTPNNTYDVGYLCYGAKLSDLIQLNMYEGAKYFNTTEAMFFASVINFHREMSEANFFGYDYPESLKSSFTFASGNYTFLPDTKEFTYRFSMNKTTTIGSMFSYTTIIGVGTNTRFEFVGINHVMSISSMFADTVFRDGKLTVNIDASLDRNNNKVSAINDFELSNTTNAFEVSMAKEPTNLYIDTIRFPDAYVRSAISMFKGSNIDSNTVLDFRCASKSGTVAIDVSGMFQGATLLTDNESISELFSTVQLSSNPSATSYNFNNMFNGATNATVDCSRWCVSKTTSDPTNFALGSQIPKDNIPVWGTCPVFFARPTSAMTAIAFDTTGRNTLEERTVTITPIETETMSTSLVSVTGLSGDYARVPLDVTLGSTSASFVVPEGYIGSIGVTVTHTDGSVHKGIKISTSTSSSSLTGFQQFSDKLNNIRIGNASPKFTVPATIPSTLTSMKEMFSGKGIIANDALKNWNTGNVTDMSYCFQQNTTTIANILNNWDVSNVTTMYAMFQSSTVCDNQIFSSWNTASLTDTAYMFQYASTFNVSLANLKFGKVSDATAMFSNAVDFNQPVGNWDTSNVVSMSFMFYNAISFNQDISKWNTSSAKYMNFMFYNAQAFSSAVSSWNTANVTTMASMFEYAKAFDSIVNSWSVTKVVDMSGMFAGTKFNQAISGWTTSSLTNVARMFAETSAFNQPVAALNLSKVTTTEAMFMNALAFNQSISSLILDKVLTMKDMFNGAAKFNNSVEGITTSSVTNMVNMFANTAAFNKPLERLDTGNVTQFTGMFQNAKGFNQPLLGWDVKSATNMDNMFNGAAVFNKDIAGWCVSKITSSPANFSTAISSAYIPVWGTCPVAKRTVIELNSIDMIGTDTTSEESRTLVITPSVDSTFKVLFATRDARFMQAVPESTTVENGFVFPENYTGKISVEVTPTTGTTVPSLQFSRPTANAATNFVKDIGQLSSTVTNTRFTFKDDFKVTASLPATMTDLSYMFNGCSAFNHDISSWVTSNVTNMSRMFSGCSLFNQPIGSGNWATAKVTNMSYMFNGCGAFNKTLSKWSLSNVTTTEGMFYNATVFNSAIPTTTSKVTNMSYMFYRAFAFNQAVNSMNVSSVTDMYCMFYDARSFNQAVSNWNVSKVTSMRELFRGALAFNKPLSTWNTSAVTSMSAMLMGAKAFDQPLGSLNVSNVTTMNSMLEGATVFNSTFPTNTPKLVVMSYCFKDALAFNQDINDLITSKVEAMQYAFKGATSFNKPLDKWDTGSVVYMTSMFDGANAFNQNISTWCVPNFTKMPELFTSTETILETENYPVWGTCPAALVASHEFELDIDTTQYTEPVTLKISYSSSDVWEEVTAKYSSNGQPITDYTVANGYVYVPIKAGYLGKISLGLRTAEGVLLKLSALVRDTTAYDYIKEVLKLPENATNVRLNIPDAFKLSAPLPKTVTSCAYMFHTAYNFNGSLTSWDVSNVTNMEGMFYDATKFNGLLTGWNTSNVTSMSDMFLRATAFNRALSHFDTSKVTNFRQMFASATSFNQDISNFNLVSATTISSMLSSATAFNKAIGTWNVSNVTNFYGVFSGATSFNQDISAWDVSSATSMGAMFYNASKFNKPLGLWDVRNVSDMDRMFSGATVFNQDITTWCVTTITELPSGFKTSSGLADLYLPVWGTCPFNTERYMNKIVLRVDNSASTSVANFRYSGTLDRVESIKYSDGSLEDITGTSSGFGVAAGFNGYIVIHGSVDAPTLTLANSAYTEIISFGDTVTGIKLSLTYNPTMPTRLGKSMTSLASMFSNCSRFNQDISGWDTSKVTNMSSVFSGATVFNQDLSKWDVSSVTNMVSMFQNASAFNATISGWNTSKVTNMSSMFNYARSFNQDLSKWDVSNVTNMASMFQNAVIFNGSVSGWNTSKVTDVSSMFLNAALFNQPLTGWDLNNAETANSMFSGATAFNSSVSGLGFTKCTSFQSMFMGAKVFNQPLTGWTTSSLTMTLSMFSGASKFNQDMNHINFSNVTNMSSMFTNATDFNGNMGGIDVRKVEQASSVFYGCTSFDNSVDNWKLSVCTNLSGMFNGAVLFNQVLTGWTTPLVTNMSYMFAGAAAFNKAVSMLTTSNVTTMASMFSKAASFNQNVKTFVTSNVTTMASMFAGAAAFNREVSSFDTSNVTSMDSMFSGAAAFNQVVNTWNVAKVTTMHSMFTGASIFNQSLTGWDTSRVTNFTNFLSGATKFNSEVGGLVTAKATILTAMFKDAVAFNKSVSTWNVSAVTNFDSMFDGATAFNGDMSTWVLSASSIIYMTYMFRNAVAFNSDISNWNVNRTASRYLSYMFAGALAFNQPIGKWALTGTPSTDYFLDGATSFSQDLSSWDISPGTYFNRNGILTTEQMPSKK